MSEQIIISISREYGSEGRSIANKIAEDMGLPLYDRRILDDIAKEKGVDPENLAEHDEKPRNLLLTRSVKGHTNSMEENLAMMQFDYLNEKADTGESFVVLGRCSESVFKDRDGLVSIFVTGDKQTKLQHTMEKFDLNEKQAKLKMDRHDLSRRRYHNRYSDFKWGDSRNYDICINSSRLGVDGTAKLLEHYIKKDLES